MYNDYMKNTNMQLKFYQLWVIFGRFVENSIVLGYFQRNCGIAHCYLREIHGTAHGSALSKKLPMVLVSIKLPVYFVGGRDYP